MRLWLVTTSAPAVIDLNTVRLETLRGAARDAGTLIAGHVGAHPAWFDSDQRAHWGFALGQACTTLDRTLCRASRDTAGCGPLDEYRATRAAVARTALWCLKEAAERSRSDPAAAVALMTAADELAAILYDADRAPSWLRERARQRGATRARKAIDP